MAGVLPTTSPVPFPRRPPEGGGGAWERVRSWYESGLGWPTAPGTPVRLRVGVRFDVLDVPAEAGHAALRRRTHGFPVALRGERMLLLVAAGGADELPGLLDWLEWGSLALDLRAVGAGGLLDAPLPPESAPAGPSSSPSGAPAPTGRDVSQGAAVWLRPPETGSEVETSLPTLSAPGGAVTAPDLARLVHTLATQCHRIRLSRAPR
ncbi:SCO3374 family protein [Streptomyces sp. JHA26]|uniref:SCO3374 family protein n=1 Tax=Streptomyces sp. JHA26 TaxID=1917143 RepID=UPI00098BA1D3|nr:SCO3374 family protein [Streptomyces sp. JHA26]